MTSTDVTASTKRIKDNNLFNIENKLNKEKENNKEINLLRNNITNYNQIRQLKLKKKIYPMGVELADMVSDNEKMKMESELSAIPEFLRFNIIESEVRNVI